LASFRYFFSLLLEVAGFDVSELELLAEDPLMSPDPLDPESPVPLPSLGAPLDPFRA
jgi:hypothetical protein